MQGGVSLNNRVVRSRPTAQGGVGPFLAKNVVILDVRERGITLGALWGDLASRSSRLPKNPSSLSVCDFEAVTVACRRCVQQRGQWLIRERVRLVSGIVPLPCVLYICAVNLYCARLFCYRRRRPVSAILQ